MLILLEIPHNNGIILSQMGVQANHMNPSVSATVEARHALLTRKLVCIKMIISFLFSLWDCYMGPIWVTGIWANPYGTHAEPSCTPHMVPIWVHMVPIWVGWC